MLWRLVSANGQAAREDTPSYSEFAAKVDSGDVKEVTLYLSQNSYELQVNTSGRRTANSAS